MGIPHHAFNCKFIMIFTAVILLFLLNASVANAYNSLFIVENIEIDITARNAVIAQEQALKEAQEQAFKILASRMLEEQQAQNITIPDSLTISSLIKDYEVINEKISSVRYVGTYKFRFDEKEVKKFFSISGMNFTSESSHPLLVLPVLQSDGKNILWSEENIWMEAWSRASLPRALVPVEVPIGDLSDISDLSEDNILRYDRKKLDNMLKRYNAKEAAIMVAVPSDNGDLRISVYRTDYMSAQHVRDIIISADNGNNIDKLYDIAVQRSYDVLQKDWKSKTLFNSSKSQIFYVRVPLENRDITQWLRINNKLHRIGGVADISILYMKISEVFVSIKFMGDEGLLRNSLRRHGLLLGQGYENNGIIIYDLKQNISRKYYSNQYHSIEPSSGGVSYRF